MTFKPYFAAFLAVLLSSVALADTITLKNGDHLTGTVVSSDGKEIVFKTDYAGEVKVQISAIQSMTSDKTLYVVGADKKTVSGTATLQVTDVVVATKTTGSVTLPVANVAAIRDEAAEAAYEASLHPSWKKNWAGGVNVGFSLARGNSQTTNLNLAFNDARVTLHDQTTLYATSIYSTNDATGATPSTIANAILGGARYDHNLNERIFAYGSGDFQHDALQNLDLRSILGGGLGVHAVKTKTTTLDLLGGINYTREHYSIPATTTTAASSITNSFPAATIGDNWTHKLGASTVLTQDFFFYPDFSDGSYRGTFDFGSVTKINKWLGWQMGFSERYSSAPPVGVKKNDVIFTTGLNFAFKH